MNQSIFVYGWLKPWLEPPKFKGTAHQDSIKGDCYEFNNDAHAINIGTSKNIIEGYTMEVTPQELLRIDKEEHPGFERKQTTTLSERKKVWVWEWPEKIPKSAKLIKRFSPEGERDK